MPVSRIGRIHLIYQFIILSILAIFIGCDVLLTERKYVYISLISIFLFVLMTLSFNTEFLPVQAWISQLVSSESLESNEESRKRASEHPNDTTQGKRSIERDQESESSNKPRIYKFRNWKKEASIENKSIKKSSSIFDASSIVPMENIREYNFGRHGSEESDLTKRYFFPFRQKRLEEWEDSKENRPYKTRPMRTNHQENTKSTTASEVSSTKNPDQPTSSVSSQSPDLVLPKSYSFPFRRKRLEHWMEIQEAQKESLEITSSLPQWQTMDYSEYDPEFRMRRSFSGSALNSEELDSAKIDKERDFSQSVEVTSVPNAVDSNPFASPSNTIDKIKAGFKDYFSKRRRESFKATKGDSKKRPFKSFFQSKENVSLNVAEKKPPKLSSNEDYKF